MQVNLAFVHVTARHFSV